MGALDLTIADPFALAGRTVHVPASGSAGDVLMTLRTEAHSARGGALFSTFGALPPQLALSGNRVVRGSSAMVAGQVYPIGIHVDAADGSEGQGATIRLAAT